MAEFPKRAMALIGALLFLVTTAGLTVVVIWQSHQQGKQNQATQNVCGSAQLPAEILADPAIYKPPAAVTTLEKTDLEVGTGQEAKAGDCLNVKYYGTLVDGTKFDANFEKPTSFQFALGQSQVIPGWDQGLAGIKVGGTRRLVVPPNLGYGDQANQSIPANSTLVFVVKLEKIGQ